MKNKEFIYEYFNKTRLGREMIKSIHVTESDLLFLIPNNVKRKHDLPLTRISGKKKKKKKEQRKKFILSFKLFDLIEKVVEDTLCSEWSDSEFFNEFVEVKYCDIGDKVFFDPSKIITVPTSAKPIKLYFDNNF